MNMHLSAVEIANFQIIADIELSLATHPLHLFAADNRQGKSSLAEAVAFALTGKPTRVEKKGDYKLLVRDGAKKGSIALTAGGNTNTIALPKGDMVDAIESRDHPYLPYLMNPSRFGTITSDQRRAFLFRLTNAAAGEEVLKRKLEKRKCDADKIEAVLPVAINDLDAAFDFAKGKASECRLSWKTLTGENYGSNKGEEWTAPKPDVSADSVAELKAAMDAADQTRMPLYQAMEAAREAATPQAAGKAPAHHTCPLCQGDMAWDGHKMIPHPGAEAEPARPTQADIDAFNAATQAYQEANSVYEQARDSWMAANRQLEQALVADEKTAEAKQYHVELGKWDLLMEAFAPDGIPAELLADSIKPMNNRLREAASVTGWEQVMIQADMSILVGGRLYQLESESSKWRADAMMTEAISFLSGTGFMMLDRVDMLVPARRPDLIRWLDGIAQDGEINTVLAFGAFAQKPAGLPASWAVHWLENGAIVE